MNRSSKQIANTFAGRAWRKNIIHVTGATDPFLETVLCNYMAYYQQTISDTLFGANVFRFCSSTIDQNNQVSSTSVSAIFQQWNRYTYLFWSLICFYPWIQPG